MKHKIKRVIQKMTAKEIIMAMVEGLRNPTTEINMNTYGTSVKGICYGCAATNTICSIANIKHNELLKVFESNRTQSMNIAFKGENFRFINSFESAIDDLRQGDIDGYNDYAKYLEIATITDIEEKLPVLRNDYTEKKLEVYVRLAEAQ